MKFNPRLSLNLLFLVFVFLFPLKTVNGAQIQNSDIDTKVVNFLEQMSPEEIIGQLFLITFQGQDVEANTTIHDLINNHHIGGVVLLRENNNFTNSSNSLSDCWALINQLQVTRYSNSQNFLSDDDLDAPTPPVYIPLFVGISQEGDGFPNDQILNGLTPIPSLLSIGATWNPDLAEQVGAIAGKELSDLGFNLFLGPSLDVLENPLIMGASQLQNRSFGGDPFWVGEMGRGYIKGLHEGSENGMVVVGTHFPGLGSTDHIPEDEVATVRKSLEQLKQIELAPFFTVTGDAITSTERVDALLTSHIRYQGLQGNIRSSTRPIGFDQQALTLLMELPEFDVWRELGGVMISDDLGSRAVRRFYDPTEQEFNARKLAIDAFFAGNDLLYLDNFIETEDPDTYSTIIRTLDFFTQKYLDDPLFADRVNQSVIRILSLKYNLYDGFNIDQVITSENLSTLGASSQITYDVAQHGVTLISPSITELDSVLPNIPGRNDFVVYFTDDYSVKQCDDCPEQSVLSKDALARAVINLYGPQSGGLVSQYYQRSYSFSQLMDFLNWESETGAIINDLNRTNWIVFVMQDISEERPNSTAIKRFLSERPDLYADKKIVVFSTNAPNFLDSTDISKLTAYYGLFSKSPPYIDIASRILFKEISNPLGSLPVSVPGVGYDLILATAPNPELIIPLFPDIPEWSNSLVQDQPDILASLEFNIGDIIPLRTGTILDSNNHPVPDNTPVQFAFTINGEEAPRQSTITKNGEAQADFIVEQSGTLVIQVLSGQAVSDELHFEIPADETIEEPTPTITSSITPTENPTSTPLPPTPTPIIEPPIDEQTMGIEYWLIAFLLSIFSGWVVTRIGTVVGNVRGGVRSGLSSFIGGLLFYTYFVLGFPGSEIFLDLSRNWGYLFMTLIGIVTGGLLSILINSQIHQKET